MMATECILLSWTAATGFGQPDFPGAAEIWNGSGYVAYTSTDPLRGRVALLVEPKSDKKASLPLLHHRSWEHINSIRLAAPVSDGSHFVVLRVRLA